MATISLCMIAQDEEECIERSLCNIKDYVDEIIIFDSGSTDRTLEIIKEVTPDTKIFHHPFEGGFSAQRNRCIEKATSEWILIMDADERFDEDTLNSLRRLTENDFFDLYCFARRTRINGYFYNIFNHDYTCRLFKNNGRIKYEGNIHENLVGFERMQLCNLTIFHDKTAEWQQKDNERCWDMGQIPPAGWKKVDGKWIFYSDLPELPHYYYPDKSAFPHDDFRQSLVGFDEPTFRQWYNKLMPPEQPPLNKGELALCLKERMIADIIKNTLKREKVSILDVGCGNGKFICAMVYDGIVGEAVGIDISDEMIKNAYQTAENNGVKVEFIRTAIETFPIGHAFDVVNCFDVLEHIYSLKDTLAYICEFVTPGGIITGSVPYLYTCNAPAHLHYFNEDRLKEILQEIFMDVRIEKIDLTGQEEFHLVFSGRKR